MSEDQDDLLYLCVKDPLFILRVGVLTNFAVRKHFL